MDSEEKAFVYVQAKQSRPRRFNADDMGIEFIVPAAQTVVQTLRTCIYDSTQRLKWVMSAQC